MKKIHFKSNNRTHSSRNRVVRLGTKLALVFFSLIVVIGFCVFAGIYLRGRTIIEDNATSAYLIGLQYSVKVKDKALSGVENSTFPMLIDSQIKGYLSGYSDATQYEKYCANQYFLSNLKKIVLQNNYIDSAYIFNVSQGTIAGTNLSHTYSPEELEKAGWSDILYNQDNYSLGHWVVTPALNEEGEILVSNFKRILDQNNRLLGIVAVNMRPEFWTDFSDVERGGGFEVVSLDYSGTAINSGVGTDTEYIPVLPENPESDSYYTDGEYTIAFVRSEYSGWCYLGVARTADMLDSLASFRSTALAATVAIVLAGSIALLLLTAHLMHPVNMLKNSMELVGTGDFSHFITERRNDDFQILYNGYNSMVENLETTVQTVYRQQLEKKDLSMQILRSQIDAHFLYNTLDTVHWISELHDDAEVSSIVMHLAGYYRIMLNQGRDLLTLRDSVQLVDNYLDIWRIKNDSSIIFVQEIPEEYLDAFVLKNIFQPLIENSIQHGMTGISAPLTLKLSCVPHPEDGILCLIMEDNGNGMPPERLDSVRRKLNGEESRDLEGSFALNNINSQLKTYYGEEYGLEIDSVPGEYTRVIMNVPIRWCEEEYV